MPLILIGLLVAFLITIVFEWGMDYLGMGRSAQSDVVGKINGRKVTYQEFSELVQGYVDNQKSQRGTEPDEEEYRQIRDQVWQSLVQEQLLTEQTAALGIKVTDQELRDWVFGENPPEDLRRNFVDSTGAFRREVYDQFLADPNQFIRDPKQSDPAYGSKWLKKYEESLRQRRMREKLQSLVTASVTVSDGELRERFAEQHQDFNASFAFFDPGVLVNDSTVRITDDDLRAYYDENLDLYKYTAARKLKYVVFNERASASDSAMRIKDMDDAVAKMRAGTPFLDVVGMYGERPDSGAFFHHGELNVSLDAPVFSARVGDVIGPIADNDGLHLVKVLGERKGTNAYAHVRHILLPMEGDSNAVYALARTIVRDLHQGAGFAALAVKYSKDPISAQSRGELPWFTKGRMVAQFEKAAFSAKIGEIVGPIRTAYGVHIVNVLARDARELKIAQIAMKIEPSPQTKSDLFERAKDFGYNAGDQDFTKAAQEAGFETHEAEIQEKGGVLPGVGYNESLSRWAFKHKTGTVSEPFTISKGYVVASITESKEAGVKTFDEVKESLRPMTLRKKKLEAARVLAASLRQKLAAGDSLGKLATLDPSVHVSSTGEFTLSGVVPGVGRDPAFVGTVAALQPGEISPAIQGLRGAYLIQLHSKTPFDSTGFAGQKETLRSRLLQDKRSRTVADWLEELKAHADIEDNRENFFR